jgi:hypothetical protein
MIDAMASPAFVRSGVGAGLRAEIAGLVVRYAWYCGHLAAPGRLAA